METNQYHTAEVLDGKKTGIFAPNDISAMATIDGYVGSSGKVHDLLTKANSAQKMLDVLIAVKKTLRIYPKFPSAIMAQIDQAIQAGKAQGKSVTQPIRVGDKFKWSNSIVEVIGTKPGGKVELFDRERSLFTDKWHKDVIKMERVA